MPYIEHNGAKLYYEQKGIWKEGKTPVLLLHGNGEDMSIFDKTIEPILSKYAFLAIDTRGHGNSEIVNGCYDLTYEMFADDVMAVVHSLGINQMNIVGFSDGAITALLLASKPDSSMHIMRIISVGANTNPKGLRNAVINKIALDKRIAEARHRDSEAAILNLMLTQPNITDDELGRIFSDVTVVAGSRDVIRKEHTEHIASSIMHARLKIIEGADHMIPQKFPERLRAIICDELD